MPATSIRKLLGRGVLAAGTLLGIIESCGGDGPNAPAAGVLVAGAPGQVGGSSGGVSGTGVGGNAGASAAAAAGSTTAGTGGGSLAGGAGGVAGSVPTGGTSGAPAGGDGGVDASDAGDAEASPAPDAISGDAEPDVDVADAFSTAGSPMWTPISGVSNGCVLEELANALDAGPAFVWAPCVMPWKGCEETVLNPSFRSGASRAIRPKVVVDGGRAWINWDVWADDKAAALTCYQIIARDDGVIAHATRYPNWGQCGPLPPGLGDGRIVTPWTFNPIWPQPGGDASYFGFLVSPLSAGAKIESASEIQYTDSIYGGPVYTGALANGRYAYVSGVNFELWTGSSKTGGDIKLVATLAGEKAGISWPVASPDRVIVSVESDPSYRVEATDGLSALSQLLPDAPGFDRTQPVYTGGYLAWLQGKRKSPTSSPLDDGWKAVELWAALYTTDPSKLQAAKVADWPTLFAASIGAGSEGWVVQEVGDPWDPAGAIVHFIHVPDGEHRALPLPYKWSTFGTGEIAFAVHDGDAYFPLGYKAGAVNMPDRFVRMPIANIPAWP